MPTTPNYSWTTPTPDGSTGAWDTILNDAIEDIDAQVKVVEDKADEALAENLSFPILVSALRAIRASASTGSDALADDDAGRGAESGLHLPAALGVTSRSYFVQINGLAPGMTLTGFRSRGQAPTNTSLQCQMVYWDTSGTPSAVGGALITHTSSLVTVTDTFTAHPVQADRDYAIQIILARTSGSGVPASYWVQPTVTRS